LMDTQGESNFWVLCFAIHSAYFASLFIPRMGEILKCVITSEIERKPIAFIFGTNILERVTDVIIYFILLAFCLAIKFELIYSLFLTSMKNLNVNSIIIVGVTASFLLAILYLIYIKIREKKLVDQIIKGLQSFTKVKNKSAFFISSIAIFVCYFLTSYFTLFCYNETSRLGMSEGFIIMVCGAFTKMLPISGGSIGAYHLVVQNVMETFGINKEVGLSYAIVNHGFQLIYTTVFGIISYVLLSTKIRKRRST
jgi:glycosyltransferase 2 family protein